MLGLNIKSSYGLCPFAFVGYTPPFTNLKDCELFLNLFNAVEESHMDNVLILGDVNTADFSATIDSRDLAQK